MEKNTNFIRSSSHNPSLPSVIKKFIPDRKIIDDLSFLEEIYKTPPLAGSKPLAEQLTSEKAILGNLKNGRNHDVCEMSVLDHITVTKLQKRKIYNTLSNLYPKSSILLSGHFFYPENGFMSWHTNDDSPGRRVYLTYTEFPGESFFKYVDGQKVISDPDYEGWTCREFTTGGEISCWHSVYAGKPRISIGFRVIQNLL